MMSDTCCKAKTTCREEGPLCEPDCCYSETKIEIKNEGKDLQRWLKYLVRLGWRSEETDDIDAAKVSPPNFKWWFRFLPKSIKNKLFKY